MKRPYAALAATLAFSLSVLATGVHAADQSPKEKCYGVSKAGQNDCAAGKGTCTQIKTPKGVGSLTQQP